MARLYILSGDDLGQIHELDGPTDLGRAGDVDVVIRGASVSRLHARIEPSPEGWVVMDLGSSNGTRVGGVKIGGPYTLQDGETFFLGDVELRVRGDTGVTEPLPSPAPAPPPTSPPTPDDTGLELEGDWDLSAPTPATPLQVPTPEPPRAPSSRASSPRAATQSSSTRGSASDTAFRRAQAMGGTAAGGASRTASGGHILQYQKVENRGGLFSTDMGQQSIGVRLLLYLLVVAVFGGLLWGAFQLTAGLRRTDSSNVLSETE